MLELTFLLTGLLVVAAAYIAFHRTRDPLHPLVIFMPLLFYTYVFHPFAVAQNEELARLFPDRSALEVVGLLNLLGVGAFCLGAAWRMTRARGLATVGVSTSAGQRRLLYQYALVLSAVAVAAFVFVVVYSGGFQHVFFRGRKPLLITPSGYISELQMLSFPALLLLAFAIRGRALRMEDFLVAALVVSPHLIMATLGGRRGPAFISICALGGFWFLATGRSPRLRTVLLGMTGAGLLLLFLLSNRHQLYRGTSGDVDVQRFVNAMMGEEVSAGDEFVVGSAYVLGAQHYGQYTFGARLFSLVFVRPIPRQVWPTKYEDLGLGWIAEAPGSGGFTDLQWHELFGFVPQAGSAGGFIADLFLEFSWACLPLCFLLGWLYNQAWLRSQRYGGLWSIIYLELLILSVHLPAQSVGAWLYRVLLLTVPTWFVWRVLLRLPAAKISAPQPRRSRRRAAGVE